MSSTRTDEEEQWQWRGDTPAAEEQEDAIHEQRQRREETVVVEVLIRTSFGCSKKRMMKMVKEKVTRTL